MKIEINQSIENGSCILNPNRSNVDIIKIILIIFKILLTIVNIFFNGIIIYLILFKLKKRTFSNFLFLSGAISDFMIGLMSIPFMTIFTSYGYWPIGEATCIFWVINDFSIGSVSIYSLLLMSIHRYRELKWPHKENEIMNKEKYSIIILKWILIYLFWGLSVILITRQNFVAENCYFSSTRTCILWWGAQHMLQCVYFSTPCMHMCVAVVHAAGNVSPRDPVLSSPGLWLQVICALHWTMGMLVYRPLLPRRMASADNVQASKRAVYGHILGAFTT